MSSSKKFKRRGRKGGAEFAKNFLCVLCEFFFARFAVKTFIE